MGRKFVIMEVAEGSGASSGIRLWVPVDNPDKRESLWLKPDRIIDGNRLRYGMPKRGDTFFEAVLGKWVKTNIEFDNETFLIIEPPPDKSSEIDEWKEHLLADINHWLSKIPRGK